MTRGGKLALHFSDDGEPSGSAGKPIFKVLEMKDLTDAVVVVSRYFGGTKLGFGGLAGIYRRAAIEAIENAAIVEKCETIRVRVISTYSDSQRIRMLINDFVDNFNEVFSDKVEFSISIPRESMDKFRECLLTSRLDAEIRITYPEYE